MIRRLLLTLLLTCLAIPALAMPVVHERSAPAAAHQHRHDHYPAMAQMKQMTHHGGKPAPDHSTMSDHACIGCIPQGADMNRTISPNGFAVAMRYPMMPIDGRSGASPSPDTPPPKPLV